MPRPRKQDPSRSHQREGARLLTLWVTEDERERLSAAAKRAGLALGPWLRMLGLRAAKPSP